MSDTPTPETDYFTRQLYGKKYVPARVARSLERERNKLREALQKISMLSQTTCLSFEAQSFKATSIACFALADIKKEAAE